MATRFGDIEVVLRADASSMTRTLRSAAGELDKVGSKFKSLGSSLQSTGRTLTATITAPVVGLGGAAVKLATDFGSSLTELRTQVGLSGDEVAAFREEILGLEGVAVGPSELADALFAVSSAGARGSEAMDILTAAAKASTIGLGDTREIALTVGAAVREFSDQNLSAASAVDVLVGTVEQGNLAASELAPALGRVLSVAAGLGVTFEDTGAFIATFTRSGVSASEAVTGLRSTLQAFLKPTAPTIDALEKMGSSIDEVRRSIREEGFIATLVDLRAQAEKMGVDFSEVIPNVEGLAAALSVTAGGGKEAIGVLAGVTKSIGTLNDRLRIAREEDPAVAFKLLRTEFERLGIEIGTALLPSVLEITDKIKDGARAFRDLSPEVQAASIKIAGIAALAGPLLLVAGSLFSILGNGIRVVAGLTRGLALLASPVALVAATFVGVTVLARALIDNFGALAAKGTQFALALKGGIVDGLAFFAEKLAELVGMIPGLGSLLAKPFEGLAGVLRAESERIGQEFAALEPKASEAGGAIKQAFADTFGELGGVAKEGLASLGSSMVEAGKESALGFAGSFATELPKALPKKVDPVEIPATLGPNAKKFIAEVEAAKKDAAKTPVEVKATVDRKSVDDFDDFLQEFQRQNPTVTIGAETEEAERSLREVEEIGKGLSAKPVLMTVEAATDEARRKLSELDGILIALSRAKDPIRVEALTTDAEAKLVALKTLAEGLSGNAKIKVEADIAEAEADLAKLEGQLDGLDKSAEIKVTADTKQAGRALDSLEQSTKDIADSMERALSTSLLGAAGTNVEIMGDLASAAEITGIQMKFLDDVTDALNRGSLTDLKGLLAAGNAFMDSFADGILFTTGRGVQLGSVLGAIGQALNKLDFEKPLQGLKLLGASFLGVAGAAEVLVSATSEVQKSVDDLSDGTITFGVQATGSPTLPISEYFGTFLPRLLENVGREAPELNFGVATDTQGLAVGAAGGGDIRDLVRLLEQDVAANRAGAAASTGTNRALTSGRAGAVLSTAQENAIRRVTGSRERIL